MKSAVYNGQFFGHKSDIRPCECGECLDPPLKGLGNAAAPNYCHSYVIRLLLFHFTYCERSLRDSKRYGHTGQHCSRTCQIRYVRQQCCPIWPPWWPTNSSQKMFVACLYMLKAFSQTSVVRGMLSNLATMSANNSTHSGKSCARIMQKSFNVDKE